MRTVPPIQRVLGRVMLVEVRKLFSNRLAWAGWLFLFVVTAVVVFVVDVLVINAPDATGPRTVPAAVSAAIGIRGVFLGQIWLTVLAASAFAGEYVARTLREDVATGVPRWALLLGKWVALGAWSLVSLVGQLLVGSLFGIGALEVSGDWIGMLSALAGTLVSELGFLAMALFVAVGVRRVAASIVAVLLFMGIERAVTAAVSVLASLDPTTQDWLLPGIPIEDIANVALPWFPAYAWGTGLELAIGNPIASATWLALVGWTALFAAGATLWFERLDMP